MSLYESAEQASRDVIDAFELEAAQNSAYLTGRIADLTGQLSATQDQLASVQSQLADAVDENAELAQTIEQLNTTIAELQARIEELENPTPPDPGVLPYWGAPAWRDEFDGATIDPAKWYVRDSDEFGNIPDKGVIERNMCTVSDGMLHMRSQWLATPIGDRYVTSAYMDHGNGKPDIYSQRYGRWEIRAKMPTGQYTLGTLPGFWLRNDNSGEIDIVEAWGFGTAPLASSYQKNGTSTTTIFTDTNSGSSKILGITLEEALAAKGIVVSKAYADFHTWAFEYTPTYAATFLDGHECFRITPATHPGLWGPGFQTPLHVRLSLHMGPHNLYYGYPDPNNKHLTANVDYQVDYVRIWAMPA